SGAGVNLTVTGVTNLTGGNLIAENGGQLSLPNLTSFAANQSVFRATGQGSVLDVSHLMSVDTAAGWNIFALAGGTLNVSALTSLGGSFTDMVDTGGSILMDGTLTTLSRVNATLDGTDAHVTDAWTQFVNGSLAIDGGSYRIPGLTDLDGSSVLVGHAAH